MRAATAIAAVSSLMLCGCASGSLPEVLGNEKGGMIDWFATNEEQVFAAATKHCAGFNKTARITSIRKEAGGAVLFECL